MIVFDNITKIVKDDLENQIKENSRLSIAATYFSIYAYKELKKQLEGIDELRFLFTSQTFTTEKAKKERREFYIPRLNRERSLYGTEFEIKLRNELSQKAIAKECADWIQRKVKFKSNITDENMGGFMNIETGNDAITYMPLNGFTTVDIGCERGNNTYNMITKIETPHSNEFIRLFDTVWKDTSKLQDVTAEVLDSITVAYRENPPDFIYFMTLYNIFSEFLEDISEDILPNEATGFKNSKIWGKLYNFQKDAALAVINKLEKYNGCILADSVGLGKTFTALAVIKYYENRNKSVLVLCPKKLADNWNTFREDYVNNPIAEDRLNYRVLYHTDLSRDSGKSNGIDLGRLKWSNFDLLVIDESHNFRNGGEYSGPDGIRENRYLRLLNKVIRTGVKTKVLMLSATPVNNRFYDLRNQLQLAYEGDPSLINEKLNTTHSIDEIFRNAQCVFNTWSKLPPENRTTSALLRMLNFDFFEVLDSVTIARSRKHIQKYYNTSDIGQFPERLKPISLRLSLTDLNGAINYNQIYELLMQLNLHIYTPTDYVFPSKLDKYVDTSQNINQVGREQGIRRLMSINLLKRFKNKVIKDLAGNEQVVDADMAQAIYDSLVENGYVKKGVLADKYYEDKKNNTVKVADEVVDSTADVISILDSIYDSRAMRPENARSNNVELRLDKSKLGLPEFKKLWDQINVRSAYVVDFETEELISKSITALNKGLRVSKIYFKIESGEMNSIKSKEELQIGSAFAKEQGDLYKAQVNSNSSVRYDLIGKIVAETGLTRATVAKILKGIEKTVFDQFKDNPEEFIIKASNLINEQKATVIIQHITYNKLEAVYDTSIFTEPTMKGQLGVNAMAVDKHLYDHILYDSNKERDFAKELDISNEVAVYVKLPNGFYINTPVGKYNPDWAIAFYEGKVKHIYFVAETKGSMSTMQLRMIEDAKIHCAREHFKAISTNKVVYDVIDSYESLINKVMK